ncbi:hypothetical protein F5Y19DRAFT_482006 [Xylariaceae sp. FL1651]|nr:hypothetical protein F5Y19DRAFT_482006 [Xylariaceae sp. FL1651]
MSTSKEDHFILVDGFLVQELMDKPEMKAMCEFLKGLATRGRFDLSDKITFTQLYEALGTGQQSPMTDGQIPGRRTVLRALGSHIVKETILSHDEAYVAIAELFKKMMQTMPILIHDLQMRLALGEALDLVAPGGKPKSPLWERYRSFYNALDSNRWWAFASFTALVEEIQGNIAESAVKDDKPEDPAPAATESLDNTKV